MNKKLLFLLLLPPLVLAYKNPHSIHYSYTHKYLVDQDGNPTHIEGHPWLRCYIGDRTYSGWYDSGNGDTILLMTRRDSILIQHPVCDVFDVKK